jgi:hypothetical protein
MVSVDVSWSPSLFVLLSMGIMTMEWRGDVAICGAEERWDELDDTSRRMATRVSEYNITR